MQESKLNIVEKKVENINELEGVLFQDVKHLLNNRETLENILFTTKVMFLNQDELVEFINKLMEYGYEDMALDYVEILYENVGALDFSKLKNENNIK
jgi:ABC-type ATPase involved in cell division